MQRRTSCFAPVQCTLILYRLENLDRPRIFRRYPRAPISLLYQPLQERQLLYYPLSSHLVPLSLPFCYFIFFFYRQNRHMSDIFKKKYIIILNLAWMLFNDIPFFMLELIFNFSICLLKHAFPGIDMYVYLSSTTRVLTKNRHLSFKILVSFGKFW